MRRLGMLAVTRCRLDVPDFTGYRRNQLGERLLSPSEIRVADPLPPRGLPAQTAFVSC